MNTPIKYGVIGTAVAAALGASLPTEANPTPRGRIHMDYAVHDSDVAELQDGFFLRRARLGLSGKIDDTWSYMAEADFAENSVAWKDVYLRHNDVMGGALTFGQVKVPFGLDEMTSSNSITFIERASPMAFAPAHRMGVTWNRNTDATTFTVMGFGQEVGVGAGGDEGLGIGARYTFAPIKTDTSVLHLGVAGMRYRAEHSNVGSMRFRQRPEARPDGRRLIDTGNIAGASSATAFGLETAWVQGPFSLQGEYITNTVNRDGLSNPSFDGWYVAGSWFLTGENRRYSNGTFGGPRVKDPAKGAWEVAARYSNLDLDDVGAGILGGRMRNATVGVNWYARNNVRFMLNYIMVDTERQDVSDDPNILLFRAQVSF
jgi:phosphate-selective porin OprO and OprP